MRGSGERFIKDLGVTKGLKVLLGAALLILPVPVLAQGPQTPRAQPATSSAWTPVRLADGQPDVQGTWGAVLGGVFSLTNPMTGGQDFEQRLGGPPVRNPSRIVDPPDG